MGVQNSSRYLTAQLEIIAMCNELDRIAFCIWRIIDSHLSPTSSLIFFSTSFEQPPRTSMMMLYWLTLYSGYRFVSSSLSWLYFVAFSKSLDSIFQPWTAHFNYSDLLAGLVLSLVLSMIVASILLAFTWVVSANNGTSQKAVACSFSYSGLGNWLIIIIIIRIGNVGHGLHRRSDRASPSGDHWGRAK